MTMLTDAIERPTTVRALDEFTSADPATREGLDRVELEWRCRSRRTLSSWE